MKNSRTGKSNDTTAKKSNSGIKKPDRGKYVKVARVGKVSIYRRGRSYWI